jgi:hypothetical protein
MNASGCPSHQNENRFPGHILMLKRFMQNGLGFVNAITIAGVNNKDERMDLSKRKGMSVLNNRVHDHT